MAIKYEFTQQSYDKWREKVDEQKARLKHERSEFEKNCATRYIQDGRTEGLDEYINYMSIEFTKVATKAQTGIDEMENMLANAEIIG
jgi:hypothetical protein